MRKKRKSKLVNNRQKKMQRFKALLSIVKSELNQSTQSYLPFVKELQYVSDGVYAWIDGKLYHVIYQWGSECGPQCLRCNPNPLGCPSILWEASVKQAKPVYY